MNHDLMTQALLESAAKKEEKKKRGLFTKLLFAFFCFILFAAFFIFGIIWASETLRDSLRNGNFRFPDFSKEESIGPDGPGESDVPYRDLNELCEDVRYSLCAVLPEGYGSGSREDYGTGVFIGEKNDSLYIATCYHILEGKNRIDVIISCSNYYTNCSLRGYDKDTDLAVLEIRKNDLPEDVLSKIRLAVLGDSDSMQTGELAVVIGNPVNLQFKDSLSAGVISSSSRSITLVNAGNVGATYVLLQTDASVNMGDSGAPLLNGRGEVIGFCNAGLIALESEGIHFATPSATAAPVFENLINFGRMSRPYLGILGLDSANWEYAEKYSLPDGVLVTGVSVNGPAELAGIQEYDLILDFNGHPIQSFDDLKLFLAECEIGSTVPVTVYRFLEQKEPYTVVLSFKIQDKADF